MFNTHDGLKFNAPIKPLIFPVLSIDAWAVDKDSWTWNQWFNTGDSFDESIEGVLNHANAMRFFFLSLGYIGDFNMFKKHYDVEDDGYNYALIQKSDYRPLYAIEYGSQI